MRALGLRVLEHIVIQRVRLTSSVNGHMYAKQLQLSSYLPYSRIDVKLLNNRPT